MREYTDLQVMEYVIYFPYHQHILIYFSFNFQQLIQHVNN